MAEFKNTLETAMSLLGLAIADLEGGFVVCGRCGDQEDTKDMDVVPQLREVMAMLVAADQVEQKAMGKWQPISTAPKDGTVILGALIGSDVPQSIRYVNGGWHLSWDDYRVAGIDGPSHWQPLPLPPANCTCGPVRH